MGASNENASTVVIEYIGKRDPWYDRLYRSGLSFNQGQTRSVPASIAKKLLRHTDLFKVSEMADDDEQDAKKGKASSSKSGNEDAGNKADDVSTKDDTEEQLAKQAKVNAQKDKQNQEIQALYDQVQQMDKDALKEFAETKYGQKINKSFALDKLQQEVIGMIDQFGVV